MSAPLPSPVGVDRVVDALRAHIAARAPDGPAITDDELRAMATELLEFARAVFFPRRP